MTETRSEEKRPLVLIDVDGVLNPFYCDETPPGYTAHRIPVQGLTFTVRLNPAHGPLLLALAESAGAELAWGTTWEHHANALIGPVIGLPELPVAPMPVSFRARHKAEGFVPWIDGRPFVWFEDEPSEADAAALLASQPHRIIWVDPKFGLTEDHIAEAARWLQSIGVAP